MVWNHSAQVMTRGLSPGTTHLRPLPILMYRRLRFIPCWWTGSSDNERAIKRDKDVSESQIPAVGPPKGSTK